MDKEKLKQLKHDLEKMRAEKEGGITAGLLYDIVQKFSVMKGEPGKTPQKFVDYFTDKEFKQVADDIYRMVKAQIRWPEDGKTPLAGKDYPTHEQVETIIRKYVALIPNPLDGRDGKDADPNEVAEIVVARLKEELPQTGEMVRDSLESLEDKDKLSIQAIKDLQDKLDELRKSIQMKSVSYGGGGGVGKHNVVAHDLSDSLSADGSVRSFNLPAFWKIVSVHLSSFPNILRPTVDFTVSGSTLTFTAEIPAASISSPQTCIILYSE